MVQRMVGRASRMARGRLVVGVGRIFVSNWGAASAPFSLNRFGLTPQVESCEAVLELLFSGPPVFVASGRTSARLSASRSTHLPSFCCRKRFPEKDVGSGDTKLEESPPKARFVRTLVAEFAKQFWPIALERNAAEAPELLWKVASLCYGSPSPRQTSLPFITRLTQKWAGSERRGPGQGASFLYEFSSSTLPT
jgi:hypothetical protein